jgi:hypothetical protein
MRWVVGALALAALATAWGCTIDPGPNFVIPQSVFNEDYFYCVVEPKYLFGAASCGAGQTGDNSNCHFNSSAVSGMALQQHTPIECDTSNHPTANGKANITVQAKNNFSAASLEMSRQCVVYSTCQASILTRPTSTGSHPRQVFCDSANGIPCAGGPDDATLAPVIYQWASTP